MTPIGLGLYSYLGIYEYRLKTLHSEFRNSQSLSIEAQQCRLVSREMIKIILNPAFWHSYYIKLMYTIIMTIMIVKYCQNIFRFELPSVRLSRLKTRLLASYSSVNNSVCRHILIHGWPLCFRWYTYLIVLVLLGLFVYLCIHYYQIYGE